MPRWWAGIDWSQRHGNEVAVVDDSGKLVARDRFPETPDGVRQLRRLLAGLSTSHRHSAKQVPVGIETSRGLLVAALRKAGQPVIELNPAMVARYRGRLSPTRRRKSAPEDALLLANILRIDGGLHRPLWEPTPEIQALKALVREQWRACRAQRYYDNRLNAKLSEYFPAALEAWEHMPRKLLRAEARAVLALAPTPTAAARLSRSQIARTLAEAGRTRLVTETAAALHEVFCRRALRQPPEAERAMGRVMLITLEQLNQACAHAEALTAEIGDAFAAHPDSGIYASFPGAARSSERGCSPRSATRPASHPHAACARTPAQPR